MVVLANLTEAQRAFAQESESDRLDQSFLDQPPVNPLELGLPPIFRRKRQEPERSFTDQDIRTALENENACNPVLRASANAIIETVE